MKARCIASSAFALTAAVVVAHSAIAQPVVVLLDATGKLIGPLIGQNAVVLNLRGQAVQIYITAVGFEESSQQYYYESNDCSGTAYIAATGLPRTAYVTEGAITIVMPSTASRTISANSIARRDPNAEPSCSRKRSVSAALFG